MHSVFERVVNVQDADGQLLTIASRDVDDAPSTLVLDVRRFTVGDVRAGDDAVADPDALVLCVGPFAIGLDAARAWKPTLPLYPADDSRLRSNLACARACIGDGFDTGAAFDGEGSSALAQATATMFDQRAAGLCDALRRHDVETAIAQGRAMIGLGPGLTPCGDDFLVGLFAVLHMTRSRCAHLDGVCEGIVAGVGQRTNAISAAALEPAARGHVRASIVALLTALTSARRQRLMGALSRVLAIGSTSGAAIALGIVAGFDVSLQTSTFASSERCRRGSETVHAIGPY